MTTITSKVIADSISPDDKRITTFELRYPRFIHAEFMTHRMISRNASSSRAVPVSRLISDIEADPAKPLFWGRNQKGMQAGEEHDASVQLKGSHTSFFISREEMWENAMRAAIKHAEAFDEAGYHKQIVNRLLEPFSHINVVATATEWENFFHLRCHEDAEPHMRMLAEAIRQSRDESIPVPRNHGDWHLPYVKAKDRNSDHAVKLSVARCASVSYKTVDGKEMTHDRAVALYEKLVGSSPIHASPTEHQAVPAGGPTEQVGNFYGWAQFRKSIHGECYK